MDKELLFKPRLEETTYDIEDVGTIRFRALTRDEVAAAMERHTDDDGKLDNTAYEHNLVALAMVDPALEFDPDANPPVDDVATWSAASGAGELVDVIEKIRALSKLGKEGSKSGVPGNRQQRRASVRARSRR